MAQANPVDEARKMRGYAIISKGDTIKQLSLDSYLVPSQSTLGVLLRWFGIEQKLILV